MKLKAHYTKRTLKFKFDAGTSRGILREKQAYFIHIYDDKHPEIVGIGECGPLSGLSLDDRPDFEQKLQKICENISKNPIEITNLWVDSSVLIDSACQYFVPEHLPSIRFGLETALYDRLNGGKRIVFDNEFSRGEKSLPINGLIWMGDTDFMLNQIETKLQQGFSCLKMKVGAIDWESEHKILQNLRKRFSAKELSLRVDANGAFSPAQAKVILAELAKLKVHSIEQPIAAGQTAAMAELCRHTPTPIALDEELIRHTHFDARNELIEQIKPQYLVLKPSLLGGFAACSEWISIAETNSLGWWITSALESNIGLNAISQFTAQFLVNMPQGLGTGQLYTNNIESPLRIDNGFLQYQPHLEWEGEL